MAPTQPTAPQLEDVKASIRTLLHQPDYDDGSAGPVLVRLAWHSAGTYDATTNTGGSNGAGMRYEAEGGDPANAGLQHARAFLEPIKAQYPWITYADLWTLAAVVAIQEMGGPAIPWRGGRTDMVDDSKVPPRGRLPDGAQGADHLRWIFYRMGFDDREIVALSGAHNLGRCHGDRSGFEGKWVNNPTRFSNQCLSFLSSNSSDQLPEPPQTLLLANDWQKKTLASGVEQYVYVDEDAVAEAKEDGEEVEELMMLPTDISLLNDPSFRPWVEQYAKDKELFFAHFAAVFEKLMELGLKRDASGNVINEENVEDGYRSAPKKSDTADAPGDQGRGQVGHEAHPIKAENEKFQRRKEGAKL
ncbi:peroxiredoxin [Xylariaceae sp. FL0016]|nr:peroxiredoxin [Xylariaceae sp. FL0016]